MTLRYSVLASGSTGNALYIETERAKLLVDAGLTGKAMQQRITEIGRSFDGIDALLVTHEHSDHIKGVGILARKYNLPIYANAKTWDAMESLIGKVDPALKFHFEVGEIKQFGDIEIESFNVSHDAADPMFYQFAHDGRRLAHITDTGYVSDRMKGVIRGPMTLFSNRTTTSRCSRWDVTRGASSAGYSGTTVTSRTKTRPSR